MIWRADREPIQESELTETQGARLIHDVLTAYDVGDPLRVEAHGGTAAGTWKVLTSRGAWLVRTRGVRTSSDQAIAFDHGLRAHLVEHGVPTTAPLAACDGCTYVRRRGRVYEVYPFIEGEPFDAQSEAALAGAARALARFHDAASSYPLARSLPPLAQYSTLGIEDSSDRMEDPVLLDRIYAGLTADPACAAFAEQAEVCRGWLSRLLTTFGRAVYDALPHALTHGDYTQGNLLFDDQGVVVGVFDLDWARWAPRVRDLADGLYFISGVRRSPLQAGDIWSLTDLAELDVGRCARWISAYAEASALTDGELGAVPLAFACRWLSVRVEGMAKVAELDRLRFCFRGIEEPLEWIEENWGEVLRRVS